MTSRAPMKTQQSSRSDNRDQVFSERKKLSGGSAGAGGFDFQAEGFALVSAKLLAKEALNWVEVSGDRIPEAIWMETGTGGDDIRILLSGHVIVELQAKRGLNRSRDLWDSLIGLAKATETNSEVHGVLLVNSEASGTVRTNLKQDIVRIGQERLDDLKGISREFIQQLERTGIKDIPGCCKRLRIIIRDFEPGSSGEEETLSALRRVVADEKYVGAARNTLVSVGHDLMQVRGRLDATDLARKLRHAGIALSKEASNLSVFLESFFDWSARSNETFVVPGLGLTLPIEQAWVSLRAMDSGKLLSSRKTLAKQIDDYLEWHRLAETTRSTDSFSIETAAKHERLLVIVAGPGAGKSTLTRRLTWVFSEKSQISLRVSLRALAIRIRLGESFEEALISTVASDGFSISKLDAILRGSAVTLLADGLDETNVDRAIIANHLRNWALADDERRVIVTTRPVGHDPAWFGGWKHFELLPLTQEDIKNFVQHVYGLRFPNDFETGSERAEAFLAEVKKSRTATIASRNPQLLGLLLSLYVSGSDLSGNRFELFDRAIELIRQQTNRDRRFLYELPTTKARRSLECIGWELLNDPMISRRDLVERVGAQLATELQQATFAGQQLAEESLCFWEERGLLEQLSSAGESASVFVHLTFRDQTAASYLSKLPGDDFKEWVRTKGQLPEYREALLLTGGTRRIELAVETLLEDDDAEDPISTSALLAADVLAEAQSARPELQEQVISHLLPRLTSSVPLVVYETGEKLRSLTLVCPSLIGPVAQELSSHESKWIKTVACALSLLAGDEYVNSETLLEIYPEVSDTRMRRARISGVRINHRPLISDLLLRGTDYLLRSDATSNYVAVVKEKVERGDFSSGVWDQLWQKLVRSGLLEEPPRNRLFEAIASVDWGAGIENARTITKIIMIGIIAASEELLRDNLPSRVDGGENSVGRLYGVLQIGENSIIELLELFTVEYQELLIEVMRGAIVASGLDPLQLRIEAHELLSQVDNSANKLVTIEPDDNAVVDWTRARALDLKPEILFRAVCGKVAFLCVTAAELLVNAVEHETAQLGFKKVLEAGSGYSLHITSDLALQLWEAEAADLIITRLEQNLTVDCAPLIEKLNSLAPTECLRPRIEAIFRNVLKRRSVPLVEAVLKALEHVTPEAELETEIRKAFDYWLNEGPQGPVESGAVQPNAAGGLLKYLASRGLLSFDDLRQAIRVSIQRHRPEVKAIGLQALAQLLGTDFALTRESLKEIGDGQLPPELLYELSHSYPVVCQQHADEILRLLESDHHEVRIACIRVLGDGLLDLERVETLLRALMRSAEHTIRDEAVEALRRVSTSGHVRQPH